MNFRISNLQTDSRFDCLPSRAPINFIFCFPLTEFNNLNYNITLFVFNIRHTHIHERRATTFYFHSVWFGVSISVRYSIAWPDATNAHISDSLKMSFIQVNNKISVLYILDRFHSILFFSFLSWFMLHLFQHAAILLLLLYLFVLHLHHKLVWAWDLLNNSIDKSLFGLLL